jgi:hypothetical protein
MHGDITKDGMYGCKDFFKKFTHADGRIILK